MTICTEHAVMLVDHCQGCYENIGISSFMDGYCKKCGFHFKSATSKKVEHGSVFYRYTKDLLARVDSKNRGMGRCNSFSFKELLRLMHQSFHLLEGLESFLEGEKNEIEAFINKKNQLESNDKSAIAFANAFWMYDNFPINFKIVLEEFNKKVPHVKYEQKTSFEKLFNDKRYNFIEVEYQKFWINKLENAVIRKDFSVFKKVENLQRERINLSKEEVKNRWGFNANQIDKLTKSNHLKIKIVKRGKKTRYLINKSSVQAVADLKNSFVTRSQAASILGIQRDSIPRLIEAELLHLRNSPDGKLLLDRNEVESLLNKCRGQYSDDGIIGLKFYEALIKYSVNGLTIVHLLQFTLDKQIKPIINIKDGNLADLIFNQVELEECIHLLKKQKQEKHGYYMQDVMKLLNIGEKTIKK